MVRVYFIRGPFKKLVGTLFPLVGPQYRTIFMKKQFSTVNYYTIFVRTRISQSVNSEEKIIGLCINDKQVPKGIICAFVVLEPHSF